MRRMALFIMVLAWLFQGMMPAFAVPMTLNPHHAMTPTMVHEHPPVDAHAGHHAMAEVKTDQTCPDCGVPPATIACTMSLCAACTALPPFVITDGAAAPISGYPAPERMTALVSMLPAPLLPPPRA